MRDKKNVSISDTIKVLMRLDKQSLLLIDSGARLLVARQDMDKDDQKDKQLQEV